MTIAIGDKLPAATFKEKTTDGPVETTTGNCSPASASCSLPCQVPSRLPVR